MDEKARAEIVAGIRNENAWLAVLLRDSRVPWDTPSAAPGWSIRDQLAHLARFDSVAATAMTDPAAFTAQRDRDLAQADDIAELYAAFDRSMPDHLVAERLDQGQRDLLRALESVSWAVKLPWYGPPMSVASCASARLMEKFAHGQDIVDAIGGVRESAPWLVHVADLGIRTIAFSFVNRGLSRPAEPIRVELVESSTGDRCVWGSRESADSVRGSILDFCLMVTRRRHVDDTDLEVSGSTARTWSHIAQAFAGPPGPPRPRRAVA